MTAAGEILVLPAEKLEMGYRTSLVKTKGYLVLSAVIVLEQGNQEAIKARMKELTEQRVSKQPLEFSKLREAHSNVLKGILPES